MFLLMLTVPAATVALFILYAVLRARLAAVEASLAELRQRMARGGLAGSVGASADTAALPHAEPEPESIGGLFENLVGGRLLIWIGGIALVVAGFFLVLHSIEIGLVTPEMRMVAAALFGLVLLGAGEYARSGRFLTDEPRIAQALVGAGLAILYATAYGSYFLYAMIGGGTASALMLAVTIIALVLSLRHGWPTAAMGMIGGFLTPALVGDPKDGVIALLSYLALLDAAIFALAWRRGWGLLAAGAVVLSYVWTAFLLVGPPENALPAGVFVVALTLAASLLRPSEEPALQLIQPAIVGQAQLAVLVARLEFGLSAWFLFGALAAAGLLLGLWRREHRFAAPAGLLLALVLIALEATAGQPAFVPPVAAATTLLFAGLLIPFARRDPALRAAAACGALAGPLLIGRTLRPELLHLALWGALAALLAVAAVVLLALQRSGRPGGRLDIAGFAAASTMALLLAAAAYDLVPREFVSGAWLLIAVAMILAGIRIPDKALRLAGLGLLTVTVFRVFLIDAAELTGILRILSFVGLGVALIGMGRLYGTVLRAERRVRDHPEVAVARADAKPT